MTGYVTIAVTPSALRSNSDGISEALPKISSVAIAETHKKAMRLSAFKEVHCTSDYNYSCEYHPRGHCRNSVVFKKMSRPIYGI
jgi:hypothetical protein